MKNPVAKHNNTFNKPKTFRNRKKEHKNGEEKRDHPKHAPYVRCPTNKAALAAEDEDETEFKRKTLNLLVGDWDSL